MADRKLPLIYIASSGRSGSTLLDMLLGAQPGIWTAGEVQMLPFELARGKSPCGCGERVAECDFWTEVAARCPQALASGEIGRFRDENGYGKALRWAEIRALRTPVREVGPDRSAEYFHHGRANRELLDTVRAVAEERTGKPLSWLVDASKDVYRLSWLIRSGLFDIRVIHVLKDPRAFVYSKIRRLPRLGGWRYAPRMTLRWVVENRLLARVYRTELPLEHALLLRYEDLAGQPERTMRMVLPWLGLVDAEPKMDFRSGNHALSGNAMRAAVGGIMLDDQWRSAMPALMRGAVGLATAMEARRYGY